jgi:hypothetical protein
MNSPLGGRNVRLRGLGGGVCAAFHAPARPQRRCSGRLRRGRLKPRHRGYNVTKSAWADWAARPCTASHAPARPHPGRACGSLDMYSQRLTPAVTIREGGFCDFPAANSFAPGADSAAGVCAAFHAPARPQPGVLRPAASRAVETAARKSQSPPPRTRRPGRVRRSTHVCVRNRGGSADPSARIRSASHPRSQSAKADFAIFQRRIHSLLERTRRPGVRRPMHLRVRNRKLIGRSAVSAHSRQKPCPGRSRARAGFCLP